MKAQAFKIAIVGTLILGFAAHADSGIQRPTTHIDFNKMIDDTGVEKDTQLDSLDKKFERKSVVKHLQPKRKSSKQTVVDMIDAEMQISPADTNVTEARPRVDRRYNSVGEPTVVTIE